MTDSALVRLARKVATRDGDGDGFVNDGPQQRPAPLRVKRTKAGGFIFETAPRGVFKVYDEDVPDVVLGQVFKIVGTMGGKWASEGDGLPRMEHASRIDGAVRLWKARS